MQTALALVLLASFTPAQVPGPTVTLDSGPITGRAVASADRPVDAFLGIPFAAPPIGELRWRPPQPPASWTDPRACTELPPACPQPLRLGEGQQFRRQSEDCLHLNVWTPAERAADAKLPVMLPIHGGGNVTGGTASPIYDGRHLAAEGTVLVSVQYRLGVFGYLAHPALSAERRELDQGGGGNLGLLDLIAALHWVRRNIAAFGGDRERVTIFGESAGAANVTYLMACPEALGLFHRAIAESGYFGPVVPELAEAEQDGIRIAEELGVAGEGTAALAALRALPARDLVDVPTTLGTMLGGQRVEAYRFGPVVDGQVLPRSPVDVFREGTMHPVPFLAGSNLDDGSVFSSGNPIRGLRGYRLALRMLLGADADGMMRLVPAASDAEVPAAVHRVITLAAFRAPARRLCRQVEAAGGDAWLYHFSRRPGRGRARAQAVHGLEIPYVFGTLSRFGDDQDRALGAAMRRYWIAFAATGDPNGEGGPGPAWPRHGAEHDQHLEFGDEVCVGTGLDREACDLLDRVRPRR
ncbi:MAG: carboxylesterase family protein [Planctomycetes bacterium]|nr:carboxylesterase family protein [Planctomycetota bacterium]